MANIKELKKKIRSTKGTLKITTAMKLVSAAKLAKAQQAIVGSRPYAKELEDTIKTISALVQNYEHSFLNKSENKQSHLIIISANKGLCGGYNSQLVKETRKFLATTDLNFKVSFVGKKAKEFIGKEVNQGEHFSFDKMEPTYREMRDIAEKLGKDFINGEVGNVYVAYNVFNSAISFTPTIKKILPMTLEENEKEELKKDFPFDFKYEPGAKEILDSLIPETYYTSLFTCLLDALASEHGSRMASMDSAAKNCKEVIKKLTLKMNKLRQAAITTELIEVISGAEALNG